MSKPALSEPTPREWQYQPLKRVVRLNAEVLREDTDPDYEFRYIDISSVDSSGHIHLSDAIRFGAAPSRARRLVRPGDTIVSTVRTYLGSIARIHHEHSRLICSTGFVTLTPSADFDSRFLSWWCQGQRFVSYVASQSVGVSYPAISSDVVGRIPTPVPPIGTQQAVADFLDRRTARIEATIKRRTTLIAGLEEKRRSALFLGACGLLNGNEVSHDPRIPWTPSVRAPWPKVKIKYVARLGTGHTPSRAHPEYWRDCTIPWITTGEIHQIRDDRTEVIMETRENISEIGLENSAAELHPKGTVVLCRTASAGYSAIMGADMATSQDFVTWTCSDALLPRYLLLCLRAMRQDLLGRLAYGSTHKTIYFPDIEGLTIPLPSIREQREILADVDAEVAGVDGLLDRLHRQIDLLRERRSALITAAVTGQIDVA